jgi:hypothetical protein
MYKELALLGAGWETGDDSDILCNCIVDCLRARTKISVTLHTDGLIYIMYFRA